MISADKLSRLKSSVPYRNASHVHVPKRVIRPVDPTGAWLYEMPVSLVSPEVMTRALVARGQQVIGGPNNAGQPKG